MVPSAAMGRDIPVAFQGGGPHAVVLLDAFNAAPGRQQLGDGGQRDEHPRRQGHLGGRARRRRLEHVHQLGAGRQQAVGDLPRRRAARLAGRQQGSGPQRARHRRRRPGRLRRDGAGDVPPRPVPLRRLAVGLPDTVEQPASNGAITAGLAQFGGVDTRNMWGLPQLGRWKWHDPNVHVQLLADNNTRLWVFSPPTLGCSDPAAMIGYCDMPRAATGRSISTTAASAATTGTSTSPPSGDHDWGSWCRQLAAMSGELVATIK